MLKDDGNLGTCKLKERTDEESADLLLLKKSYELVNTRRIKRKVY